MKTDYNIVMLFFYYDLMAILKENLTKERVEKESVVFSINVMGISI